VQTIAADVVYDVFFTHEELLGKYRVVDASKCIDLPQYAMKSNLDPGSIDNRNVIKSIRTSFSFLVHKLLPYR
jgi:hypothetical protein